jgi:hypothetical protein
MDAFEQLVSEMLWMDGLWVKTSVKVRLTEADKAEINNPSTPTGHEVDIVAYSGRENTLRVVECKSYLDSRGVTFAGFSGADGVAPSRYKLFSNNSLWKVVSNRLSVDFTTFGFCAPNPTVRLCLACAHIAGERDRTKLREHFEARNWELWDEKWLREHLMRMAKPKQGYENQASYVVAKLLIRDKLA